MTRAAGKPVCGSCPHWRFERQGNAERAGRCGHGAAEDGEMSGLPVRLESAQWDCHPDLKAKPKGKAKADGAARKPGV